MPFEIKYKIRIFRSKVFLVGSEGWANAHPYSAIKSFLSGVEGVGEYPYSKGGVSNFGNLR